MSAAIEYFQFVLAPQMLIGLVLGVAVILVALGLTIIFGLLDVINMSHGEFYALGAFIALALAAVGLPFWLLLMLVPLLMVVSISLRAGNFATGGILPSAETFSWEHWRLVLGLPVLQPDGTWAAATVPQVMVNVAFSVVMNGVAGPKGRYELMSRRWSVLGLTTAVTVVSVGQVLVWLPFPTNYQVIFILLSAGGLISLYFSSHIELPENVAPPAGPRRPPGARLQDAIARVRQQPAFVSFTAKRFVFLLGVALAAPIFPLYLVREAQASEAAIGLINTAQTFTLVVGYRLWTGISRTRGSRLVLLWATLGLSLYPALVASTGRVTVMVVLAAFAGIFQAGLDLVFFDELMKTVPAAQTAVFVSFAQGLQYLSAIAAPLAGTLLADYIGLGGALLASAVLRLAAFALFARRRTSAAAAQPT